MPEDTSNSGFLATFTSPDTGPFSATIDCGDGTPTIAATITEASPPIYDVSGSHTYSDEGTFTVTAVVTDTSDSSQSTAQSTVTVTELDSLSGTGTAISAIASISTGNVQTASFTDTPNPAAEPSDFAATIDWGDGTAITTGTVSGPAGGSFTVDGSHTYLVGGSYTVETTLTDPSPGTAMAMASSGATVVAPPSIAEGFSPTSVALNETSTLTFTITNPAANTVAEAGVAFSDTLPTGMVVATPNGLPDPTCGGTPSATTGANSISFTGGSVAVNSSCTVSVNVTATTSGTLTNTSGAVSSTNGGTGNTATAVLTVQAAPKITSSSSATFYLGQTNSFTVTTTGNPTPSLSETGALPSAVGFTGNGDGTATLSGTPSATGSFHIHFTASNGVAPNATQSFTLNVVVAPSFRVTVPPKATSWNQFTFTVTALNANGTVDSTYAGMVHFTSSDSSAVLPADSKLTDGTRTFHATLGTAGEQTITASDSVDSFITGTSNAIEVQNPYFSFSVPATATPGHSFKFTVTALNGDGTVDSAYTGTVHFTSSVSSATLPADSKLTSGKRSFSATLKSVGPQTITGTDSVHSVVTGTSNTIAVG
ncbi:MAG: PKD domain-containing protein [Nitrososphaerales archaeon]